MIGICNHFYIVSKADWILPSLMKCLLFYIIKDVRIFFYTFHLRCGKIRRDMVTGRVCENSNEMCYGLQFFYLIMNEKGEAHDELEEKIYVGSVLFIISVCLWDSAGSR